MPVVSCSHILFPGYAQKITFTPQWSPQSQFAGYYAALEKGYYAEVGIFLIRQIMNEVRYERIDGKNVLTLEKKI